MNHNEIFKNIIKYAKTAELKSNMLYFFVIEQKSNQIICIEDKEVTMEEFSTFLNSNNMEKHISTLLIKTSIPFKSVRYTTNYSNTNIFIMPFEYQDPDSIESSFIESFFAFEVL